MPVPRRVPRFLEIHPEVHEIDDDLHMALRLDVAAHDAVCNQRQAIFRDESGDNGMKRTLPRAEIIGMLRIQAEPRAAVLQAEAQPARHVPRTAAMVDGLDERDHVPVLVSHG